MGMPRFVKRVVEVGDDREIYGMPKTDVGTEESEPTADVCPPAIESGCGGGCGGSIPTGMGDLGSSGAEPPIRSWYGAEKSASCKTADAPIQPTAPKSDHVGGRQEPPTLGDLVFGGRQKVENRRWNERCLDALIGLAWRSVLAAAVVLWVIALGGDRVTAVAKRLFCE